jgi:hypothetical protein
MRAFIALIAVSAFVLNSEANGADYKVLDELPNRLHAAAVKSVHHPCSDDITEPDSVVTAREKQFMDTLARMMRDIVEAFPAVATRESVDKFVKATYEVYKFRGKLAKPVERSEFFAGSAAADFEKVIEEMVVRATASDSSSTKFDYQSWKKRWEAAKDPCAGE